MSFVIKLFFFISLSVSPTLQLVSEDIQKDKPVYVCPPCGCLGDHLVHHEEGICEFCRMPLIEKPQNYKSKIAEFIGPVFQDENSKFYPKVIYPSFIIAFLIGLSILINLRLKNESNVYLGLFLIAFSLYGYKSQIYGVSYDLTRNPRMLFTPISFIAFLGPLLYFYVKSLTHYRFKFKRRDVIHFVPGFMFFAAYFITFLQSAEFRSMLMISLYESYLSHVEQVFSIVAFFIYAKYATSYYRKWKRERGFSKIEVDKWIRPFLITSKLVFGVWLLVIFLNYWIYDFGLTSLTYYPLWMFMAAYFYFIFIELILYPKIFFKINGKYFINRKSESVDLESIKLRLINAMEAERLFLNPSLDLNELSAHINSNAKEVSSLLNTHMNTSFYEFINGYRANEAKHLLLSENSSKLTIDAIAKEAGFKSKSTFYKVFKQITGNNPSHYSKRENAS